MERERDGKGGKGCREAIERRECCDMEGVERGLEEGGVVAPSLDRNKRLM